MKANKLEEINLFEDVFVDSNILTYHLLADSVYGESSKSFIGRVETGEINGFISTLVISETVFNFIKAGIKEKHQVKVKNIVKFLKKNPAKISEIELETPRHLFGIFRILPVTSNIIELSHNMISRYSMLPNDAIHLSTMETYGITNLASNDSDFERVPWIKLYKPSES